MAAFEHDEDYELDDIQNYEECLEYQESNEDEMTGMARAYGFNLLRHCCAIDPYYDEDDGYDS